MFTRPEELVEYFAALLEAKKGVLGLGYIAKYEENLLPSYPAVLIQPGQFQKEVHGTATYAHTLRANIYIMHADLSKDKRTRSLEDCQLATAVIGVLEASNTLEGNIIFGMVESDAFAPLPPKSQQSAAVISTRLQWMGIAETRFK